MHLDSGFHLGVNFSPGDLTQWSLKTQWKKAREQNLQKHGLLELTLRTGKSCKGQECNRVSEMGDGQTAQ